MCSFAYSPEAAATAKCTRLGGMPAAMGISRFARHSIYVVTWNDPWLVHLCILANMRGCHDAWSVQEINLKTYERTLANFAIGALFSRRITQLPLPFLLIPHTRQSEM